MSFKTKVVNEVKWIGTDILVMAFWTIVSIVGTALCMLLTPIIIMMGKSAMYAGLVRIIWRVEKDVIFTGVKALPRDYFKNCTKEVEELMFL